MLPLGRSPFSPLFTTQADNRPSSEPYTLEEREALLWHLERKNIEPILNSPRLFWRLFCTAFQGLQQTHDFRWSFDGEQFTYRPRGFLNELLHSSLERARCALLDGYTTRLSTIFFPATHKILKEMEGETFLLPLSQDLTADFSSIGSCQDIPDYFTVFLPCFTALIDSLGGKISTGVIQPQITNCWWFTRSAAQSGEEALYIDFPKIRESYPIPPRPILPRTFEAQQKSIYDLYQRQLFCDTNLLLNDGELKIHAVALFPYGGQMIQKILSDSMQNFAIKIVHLPGFSMETASAFADFIYLGPDTVEQNEAHVYELLRLAYFYQIESLIDCCTNLITRLTLSRDAEMIDELAKHYDNAHLKAFYEHLISRGK